MYPFPLAMHMANELLSLPVAGATLALGAAVVALAAAKAKSSLDPGRLPLMGVMGAFVFAAQMINFTLPGMPGTSGHLGGGVLLSILLGPSAGIVTMAAILIVQCLLFQDGGLLALGCNLLNMGVVPCLAGWAVYHVVTGRSSRPWRIYAGAWAACLAGITGGAILVPFESAASGVLRVPTMSFLGMMAGVHLLIAFIEGLITFAVLAYLRRVSPMSLRLPASPAAAGAPKLAVAVSLAATAFMLAGVVSWFASSAPDGLESCLAKAAGRQGSAAVENTSPAVAAVDSAQAAYAPLPDYSRRPETADAAQAPAGATACPPAASAAWGDADGWKSLAGLIGTAVTLALTYAVSRLLRRRARKAPI